MKAICSELRSFFIVVGGAIAVAAAVPAGAQEVAGHFQFVVGDVRVLGPGGERPARRGDAVREGETIISGLAGTAQLRMTDEAFVAVRQDTQLRIDQYNYKGRNDGTESGVLNLVRGTFRAFTGLIVRARADRFTLRTASATIGIRGTGNITHHDQAANATINHTVTGSHTVSSVAPDGQVIGTVITSPGQTIQVVIGQPPRQIPTPPLIFAEASRDPKAAKTEPEKEAAPTSTTVAAAETETRETQATLTTTTQTAPTVAPTTTTTVTTVTAPPPPTTSTQQIQGGENLQITIQNAMTAASDAAATLAGIVSSAQSAATSASGSATTASMLSPVDLSSLNQEITLLESFVTLVPSIQTSLNEAKAARDAAFNAAGSGNTSSQLAAAQAAASTAATNAGAQSTAAQTAASAASSANSLTQQLGNQALDALAAGDTTLAVTLADEVKIQSELTVAKRDEAQTAATAAQSAASTASSQATTASNAVASANSSVTTALAAVATATQIVLNDVEAVFAATTGVRDEIAAISTALGTTGSGTSAQTARDAANSANTSAQGKATDIADIAAINTSLATSNASGVNTIATASQTTVAGATAVYNANANVTGGVGGTDFRDVKAAPALAAMNTANSTIQSAKSTADSAASTATTQSNTLTSAKSSAVTQGGAASTAFDTVQTTFSALSSATQVDAGTTNPNQTVSNLLDLANVAVAAAEAAKNLGTPEGVQMVVAEYNKALAYKALAQQIQTVVVQGGTVTTADGQLTTLLSSANTAKTQGDAAVSATTTALGSAQTNETIVTQQSTIAQYSNPTIVSSNRFASVGVGAKRNAASSNERLQTYTVQQPNTNFALDGRKNLVENRDTLAALDQGNVFGTSVSGAMTIEGSTAADTFVHFVNTPGAENYMALGRWTGGQVKVDGTTLVDLGTGTGARSFHWIVGYEPPAGYVSPTKLTGTTTYTKIANTSPTDASGNVGTLNSATLAANFSAQTVAAGVNVTIASKTLDATTGTAPVALSVGGPGTPQFGGPFQTVACTGTCPAGTFGGELTGSLTGSKADGAGFVYSLFPTVSAGSPYTDLVQGAVAFSAATPPELIPQPPANIATAYLYGSGSFSATSFQASGTSYTLDGDGNLTQVSEIDLQESQTISGGTALTRGQVTSTGGSVIDFGRWQGGSLAGTDFDGSFTGRAVDGVYHWMKGPVIVPFYLTSALTGTASYTSQGGTVTDPNGIAGTLDDPVISSLSVNFTQQSVAVDIRATTSGNVWQGVGTGIRLEPGGQFFAGTGTLGGSPHNNMSVFYNGSTAFGVLDGILMGNGADAAGVSFAFGHISGDRAAGTVAFTGTAQSESASYVVGIVAAGKLGTPLSGSGTSTTGTTTLASLDADLANSVSPLINASSRVVRDGAGNVTRFDGEVPLALPLGCSSAGTACTGTSSTPGVLTVRDQSFPLDPPPSPGGTTPATALTNAGTDSATGISWGRYVGFISYTDRIGGTTTNPAVSSGSFDARTSNWHAIWSSIQTSPPVLPSTGTVTYTAVGGTNPSDSLGNVGTWSTSTATLSANFTNMTVNTAVNAVVGPNTWAASASNMPILNGAHFEAVRVNGAGSLNVTCTGTCASGPTSGNITGAFTGNAATGTNGGAMLGYSFNQGGAAGVTMQGVTAFKK